MKRTYDDRANIFTMIVNMRTFFVAPALFLSLVAGIGVMSVTTAQAEGFSWADLGSVPSDAICIDRGDRLFRQIGADHIFASE